MSPLIRAVQILIPHAPRVRECFPEAIWRKISELFRMSATDESKITSNVLLGTTSNNVQQWRPPTAGANTLPRIILFAYGNHAPRVLLLTMTIVSSVRFGQNGGGRPGPVYAVHYTDKRLLHQQPTDWSYNRESRDRAGGSE